MTRPAETLPVTVDRVLALGPARTGVSHLTVDTLQVEFATAGRLWEDIVSAGFPVASVSSFEARLEVTEPERPLVLIAASVPATAMLPVVAQALIEVRDLADSGRLRHLERWEEFTSSLTTVASASTLWWPVRSETMDVVGEITAGLPFGELPDVSPAARTLAVLLADDIGAESMMRGLGHAVPSALMSARLVETALALHDDPVADSRRPEGSSVRVLRAARPQSAHDGRPVGHAR